MLLGLRIINLTLCIFKFDKTTKKFRRATTATDNGFTGTSKSNKLDIPFDAKKFGASSYWVKISTPLQPGEYGIIVSDPNSNTEKQAVVSTFAVVE